MEDQNARLADPARRSTRRVAARKYASSDRNRELRLQKLYGIGAADYDAMLAAQNGACGICGAPEPGGRYKHFHVDHCHSTGAVRGLLCARCNIGIGYFNDNPKFLIQASLYLGAMPLALGFFDRKAA